MARRISDGLVSPRGRFLCATGVVLLLTSAGAFADPWYLLSAVIFVGIWGLLYRLSRVCVLVRQPRYAGAAVFVDRFCLLLLVIGTYAPFAMVVLTGMHGWMFLALFGCLAVFGVAFGAAVVHSRRFLTTMVHLVCVWVGIVVLHPVADRFGLVGNVVLLGAGLGVTLAVAISVLRGVTKPRMLAKVLRIAWLAVITPQAWHGGALLLTELSELGL